MPLFFFLSLTILGKFRAKVKPCFFFALTGTQFLVLRVRDVAEHPVDVRFATTGVERRPLRFRPAGLERTKKGYPPRISFFVSLRARDGTRTRDPDLGKVVLHQLSHSRILNYCLLDISYLITGFPKLQALFKVF